MGITFHCDHCGRKIEAKDDAGGKWGKCPACQNKVYIPDPHAEEEELKLAPIDEEEEKRKEQMKKETYEITQDILEQKNIPEGEEEPQEQTGPKLSDKELKETIIGCLKDMHEGNDEDAEQKKKNLAANKARGMQVLEQIALSDIPEPELEGIAQQELSGYIRELRTELS